MHSSNVKQKRRWLAEFALVSLLPIALLGLIVQQTLQHDVSGRVLTNAREEARLIAGIGFATPLSGVDLTHGLTSDQEAALDAQITTIRAGNDMKRVVITGRDGHIVYADDHSLIGQTDSSSGIRSAVNGDIVSNVANDQVAGRVLEVDVPLTVGTGVPMGAAEIWLPYGPIASQISKQTSGIDIVLVVGLVFLWGILIAIVATASERLRRQAAEKEELALSDGLTGLPNRTMFLSLVHETLTGAGRRKKLAAIMLMDLDRFKDVNDTLGHHNGDLLLQRIGSRLDSVLRNTATVARLGGDEFAILVPDITDRQAVIPLVRRVLKVLEEPVVVGGLALQVEASIGIALFPEHGRTVESVMRAADVAMYVTKENRSGYEFYDEQQHEGRQDAGRLALIGELRRAMDETELVLYYQPKIDLRTGRARGVEALARWRHPERGLLSPDEFIPLAERSNLLRPMTLFLIDTALRQANAWRAKGMEITVAVNLSMQNMLDLRLPNDLARLLTSWRLPPGSLELEITESTIMADHRRATTILKRLSKMGVRLSIDDFGTGYSSLAYLQELPVDAIKIDRSFVMTMSEDQGNATIVQSTVDLGHNLGLEVVAEGVETIDHYNALSELGCDYAQGYFLSKPLEPEKMALWLEIFGGLPARDPAAVEADDQARAAAAAAAQEAARAELAGDVEREEETPLVSLDGPSIHEEPLPAVELAADALTSERSVPAEPQPLRAVEPRPGDEPVTVESELRAVDPDAPPEPPLDEWARRAPKR